MQETKVGTIKTGVTDLKGVLSSISKDSHLVLQGDTYVLVKDSTENDFEETFCGFDEKYEYSIYDNQDLEYYEQERLVDGVPESPRFPLKTYLANRELQIFIDSLLEQGMFALKADSTSQELYVLFDYNY